MDVSSKNNFAIHNVAMFVFKGEKSVPKRKTMFRLEVAGEIQMFQNYNAQSVVNLQLSANE